MNDEYSHQDQNIYYVNENIPGPVENSNEYKLLNENFNSELTHHCQCDFKCDIESCNCLKISGDANYISSVDPLSNNECLILNKCKINVNYPIVECNNHCQCYSNCGNRVVQNGPFNHLYVKLCRNEAKGLGLFTSKHILKGMFICEYAGEVITKSQALSRHAHNQSHGIMNYIFCLQEHVNEETQQFFIDPSRFGNIGRYINHSCDPNCEIYPVRINNPIPKLAIFSCADIFPNTEITFDYGANSLSNPIVITFGQKKPCLCESDNCTKVMPFHIY